MVDTIDGDTTTKRKNGNRSRRKGGGERYPAWMVSWKAAEYCDMTDTQWKHHRGKRPPPVGDRRSGFRYQRTDLDAWMEMRRLGLWADWKQLREAHGEHVAWAIMLRRLEKKRVDIDALALEVV
jgi:hypothetical protein